MFCNEFIEIYDRIARECCSDTSCIMSFIDVPYDVAFERRQKGYKRVNDEITFNNDIWKPFIENHIILWNSLAADPMTWHHDQSLCVMSYDMIRSIINIGTTKKTVYIMNGRHDIEELVQKFISSVMNELS